MTDPQYYNQRKGFKLLSKGESNTKTDKRPEDIDAAYLEFLGDYDGILAFNLSFAHARTSGFQVCVAATKACEEGCLGSTGRAAIFPMIKAARIRKTRLFFLHRELFLKLLIQDIERARRQAKKKNLKLVIRLNCFSDVKWEDLIDMASYPDVTYYDYTKRYDRLGNVPSNYHLTFSLSDKNKPLVDLAIKRGFNVAVPFFTPNFPKTFQGQPVVNGDAHDFTFLHGDGVILGLKAKGKVAKADSSGFIQISG